MNQERKDLTKDLEEKLLERLKTIDNANEKTDIVACSLEVFDSIYTGSRVNPSKNRRHHQK